MWLWTRAEAQKIDQQSIAEGRPAESLMEEAGQKCTQKILQLYPKAKKFLLLCGPGNNGGDGYVIARILRQQNFSVQVIALKSENNSPLNIKKYLELDIPTLEVLDSNVSADLIIDALFGIGLNRPLAPPATELIAQVNELKIPIVAIDTPSGLDVDTGNILGSATKATHTLSIGAGKPGFYLNQGPECCGAIIPIPLSFSAKAIKSAKSVFLLEPSLVKKWLPQRKATDNKSQGGKTLIYAGSKLMPGAATLAAQAAFRVGTGYVYTREKKVLSSLPECLLFQSQPFDFFRSILIGPGLGTDKKHISVIKKLKSCTKPVVIDADALNLAARHKLYPFPGHWIATPHAAELSRFFSVDSLCIESDRLTWAQAAQKKMGCTVVLKGFHTLVAYPGFSVIVPTGNVALAKGGSGDILAGMIAGFLSQNVSPERAPLLACYLHGSIADRWLASGRDYLSLTPTDILETLPRVLKALR